MQALAASCEELRARTGKPPLRFCNGSYTSVCLYSVAGSYGLEASKIEERLGDLVPFLAKFVCFLQIVVFRQFWGFFRHFFEGITFQIVQLNM